ncbi:hypothetical protein MCOR27_007717 [Pyricularia oryzae]|uniref:Uncharacterized protein n=4 Tax=Pyricularia TaxID=48558 RepID=A0ABQ8NMB1_PYRGI|nr:uncharacterized protein MGG_16679 [Pyricularia oryzae 70-15]ELQ39804.1 hypothetical protein OOU_Y34scaffold00480g1 [Pyricularia oryzae Y34]KAI6256010.1 hypothetical protein MCOR19_007496 [Pyricularia oryzae]KAI6299319.1 hypothetical protein MCOR33_004736 [Pyricularia grisea]EHA51788.1 hypothetical protein MGG_16679 [Pyricularia oryzae 70-15]KAI6273808.1 hypothetical protein MCOR27_007717 [Pyricularia oryzae]
MSGQVLRLPPTATPDVSAVPVSDLHKCPLRLLGQPILPPQCCIEFAGRVNVYSS